MSTIREDGDPGASGSKSVAAILGALVPASILAAQSIIVFLFIRNWFRKVYAPRTFLGTIPEKDRTPASRAEGARWIHDFRKIPDTFVLQHNSLDAFLFLRFLKFTIAICLAASCLTWPILFPINATGGGQATQLDKISFSNIAKNSHLWAHTVVAWVLFLGILVTIAFERLQLIGIRQARYLNDENAEKLSTKTVLFLNVPSPALQPDNLRRFFGEHAERCWPVYDAGELPSLVEARDAAAYKLESAEMDFIVRHTRGQRKAPKVVNLSSGPSAEEGRGHAHNKNRPTARTPPLIGTKVDCISTAREQVTDNAEQIEARRAAPREITSKEGAIFVTFSNQAAAHRAFQLLSFQPRLPLQDRFLGVQPKEVLWQNVQLAVPARLSKASLGLVFVVVFTIFFAIPVGLLGSISNVSYLANNFTWLEWLNDLPDPLLGLLEGFVPPFLTSWFISYVPKLFRHIAKLSGEPTVPQAELKTQAWFFTFQVFQLFLVTTFSSGAAAVFAKIVKDPASAPDFLAQSLPKASNFYLTYFIIQGISSSASNLLDYSELLQYLFYEYFWDKTPREKFTTYAQMRGTPWAAWYPKFTNLVVIAVAYSCIQPLILGFATIGLGLFYLGYRYSLLYVRQTKIDTRGESYKRALQQLPTGLYLAELCMIGLFGARKATAQTVLMIVLLVVTAMLNLSLDRMLRPLELFLGVDKWQDQEVPLLAEEDGIDPNDHAALHAASHGRRLGLERLPDPAPRRLSDLFDHIISSSRERTRACLTQAGASSDAVPLTEEDRENAYVNPVFTSKTPSLWIPSDRYGVSSQEVEENGKAGISTTDEAAEVAEDGRLHWDHRFEHVPVFKGPKVI
jgi:hypothetical protein